MEACFHEEIATKREIFQQHADRLGVDPSENERLVRRHRRKARRITPLLKYMAAEKSVEMSRRCVQIHGGNGYTKDYPGEKLLRDSMVMPIYEGTSQIQSLMAMRDALTAILKNPQDFVRRMAQARWRSLSSRDALEKRCAKIQLLSLSAQQYLLAKTAGDKLKSLQDKPLTDWPSQFFREWDPKRDFAYAMLHAERLTRLLADAMICEILLGQSRRFPERAEVLERYLDRAEPRARFLHDEITTTGARVLAQLEDHRHVEPNAAE
jgi:hypothetical protein